MAKSCPKLKPLPEPSPTELVSAANPLLSGIANFKERLGLGGPVPLFKLALEALRENGGCPKPLIPAAPPVIDGRRKGVVVPPVTMDSLRPPGVTDGRIDIFLPPLSLAGEVPGPSRPNPTFDEEVARDNLRLGLDCPVDVEMLDRLAEDFLSESGIFVLILS